MTAAYAPDDAGRLGERGCEWSGSYGDAEDRAAAAEVGAVDAAGDAGRWDDPNELNWLDELDDMDDPLEDANGYSRADLLFGGNWR